MKVPWLFQVLVMNDNGTATYKLRKIYFEQSISKIFLKEMVSNITHILNLATLVGRILLFSLKKIESEFKNKLADFF